MAAFPAMTELWAAQGALAVKDRRRGAVSNMPLNALEQRFKPPAQTVMPAPGKPGAGAAVTLTKHARTDAGVVFSR